MAKIESLIINLTLHTIAPFISPISYLLLNSQTKIDVKIFKGILTKQRQAFKLLINGVKDINYNVCVFILGYFCQNENAITGDQNRNLAFFMQNVKLGGLHKK